MNILWLDYETFSGQDIKNGTYAYAKNPTTEALLAGYAINYDPVKLWDAASMEPMPDDLKAALEDPDCIIIAWNAPFEMAITRYVLGYNIPNHRWRDAMVQAYYCALPGKLEDVAKIVGTSVPKMTEGRRLIKKFCCPRKPTKKDPSTRVMPWDAETDWALFCQYCMTDVNVMREAMARLEPFAMPDSEWQMWFLDQKINQAGFPINRKFVANADRLSRVEQARLLKIMAEETGLVNANSGPQLLGWLRERGYPYSDLTKDSVAKCLDREQGTDEVREILLLRQDSSKTSVKKYPTILRATCDDDRLRGTLQFGGASRTLRWAGRITQFQNLPRPVKWLEKEIDAASRIVEASNQLSDMHLYYPDVMPVLTSLIRSSIQAHPGKILNVADLASIETRVLGWLAGCKGILDVYAAGLDAYRAFASIVYKKNYELITKAERNICKPAVLGCGYSLGTVGLKAYAESMFVEMTMEEAELAKKTYRETYWEVPVLWDKLKEAAFYVVQTGKPTSIDHLRFDAKGPFLRIQLPSGRHLHYFKPRIETLEAPWSTPDRYAEVDALTYMGVNQKTRKWERISTHAGMLCVAEGTPVVTDRGLVAIQDVTSTDLVWDGQEWVSTGGAVHNGQREIISVCGVGMTPDHLVLTETGWRRADETEGHHRYESGVPDSYKTDGTGTGRKEQMGSKVRVWDREGVEPVNTTKQPLSWYGSFVRVHEEPNHIEAKKDARHVPSPSLCSLAVDERALHIANSPSMAQLWRARNSGLRGVVGLFRELLGGYGADVLRRIGLGSDRQQRELRTEQLPLGNPEGEQQQQARFGKSEWRDDTRHFGPDRDRQDDPLLPAPQRMPLRIDRVTTRHHSKVFDLIDCGPRNRFTVVDSSGRLLILHNCENCVQGIARDILAEGLKAADAEGLEIVGHVHDEIISHDPITDTAALDTLLECMTRVPAWAEGLPLDAAGYSSFIYKKD